MVLVSGNKMKEVLIFTAIAIAFIASCIKLQQIPTEEKPVVVTKADMTAKNGNYKYQTVSENTFNYIKKYGNGRFYRVRKKYPKVVIYTNVVDTDNPYRKEFQDTMKKYAINEKWKKGYSFISFDRHMVEELEFSNRQAEAEFFSTSKDCNYFCIIDLRKKLIFKGVSSSKEYVGSVLYAFFNN